ncbi:MAG: SpoIIIAH-like family protein [Clostridiales bacterium]|nr:SpoIIIAH-like family protein [Clostridiales bacterium]
MKLWKRNVVVAAIVLFVCVAVYLNWTYDQEAAVSTSGDTSASALASEDGDTETKTLGEAALVSSDDDEAAEETSGDTEEIVIDSWDSAEVTEDAAAETVSETGDSSGYFAEARLSREEARASALSILQETVDDPDASDAAVSAAADSITAMASATLAESQIESLVTAKGYPECVAFIGDNSVSVVVSTESGELSGADVAKITDIVLGETDFSASSVKVVLAED